MGCGSQRSHAGLFIQAAANLHHLGRGCKFIDELVGNVAHRHQHRAGQAALTRAPVKRSDHRGHTLIQFGIRHDRHDVFGAAQRLNPFAGFAAALVDIFCRGCGSHKGDAVDVRMIQQAVHNVTRAVDHVDDAFGKTDLINDLEDFGLGHGDQLRRFDYIGIAADQGIGQKPPGHHPREIVRHNTCEYAQRLAMAHAVDVLGDVFQRIAGHQRRDAGGVLDIFDHAPDFAACLVDALALLGCQNPGNFLEFFFKGLFEPEQITGPCQRRRGAPFPVSVLGGFDRLIDVFAGAVGDLGDFLTLGRVPYIPNLF